MERGVRVELRPLGEAFEVRRGSALRDLLFQHGVEFPCGGRGQCRGCRVRVVAGRLAVTPAERERLAPEEIAAGWRLACSGRVEEDVVLAVAQWDAPILGDTAAFAFEPRTGTGVAVDLGTTTVVSQLLDLRSGRVLAVEAALNPQARHGADLMSRIQYALAGGGRARLEGLVRRQVGRLLEGLLERGGPGIAPLDRVVIVGNTVMHHLFCGLDLEPLGGYPFATPACGLQVFRASELGWRIDGEPEVHFLPCLGGFVGSDILAGIVATGMHQGGSPRVLIDLGTNGEIVLRAGGRLLCASTAAGPAFEGARISQGMRAATGAISQVRIEDGAVRFEVIGGGEPRGICGSGLVDAVACGLDLGAILATGRIAGGRREWPLLDPVALAQCDIRELQLAKGAIAAGIRLLLGRLGLEAGDIERVFLAGAFGNYVSRRSARRIGLLDFPLEAVEPAGNTALRGAKMLLFLPAAGAAELCEAVRGRTEHVALAAEPGFEDTYVSAMVFPAKEDQPA